MKVIYAAVIGVLCAIHVDAQVPYQVIDLNTSFTPSAQSSNPKFFTASGSSVYFAATSATTGTELFKTNGVTVQLVKDLRAGAVGSSPNSFVDLGNGTTVFSAIDDVNGRELWITDGTEGGTGLVKDILPGSGSSAAVPLVSIGAKAFLLATTASGLGLWVTDGQEAGTVSLTALAPGPFRFAILGGVLYFSSGDALWRTDGTPGGTSIVKSGISARSITASPDQLFLVAWDQAHGYELWKSDGTEGGTTIVKDINPGAAGSFNTNSTIAITVLGTSVVFFATDGAHGLSLWRSDGTDNGTLLYHEFALSTTIVPPVLRSVGGLAFMNLTGSLWRTDGTSNGTFSLPEVLNPYAFTSDATTLYFVANAESSGYRLWKSDGSDEGTVQIAPNVTVAEADPQLRFTGGKLYFAGSSGLTGIEPWTSNGTSGGTVMLTNLMADPPASANPTELRASGGNLFFMANDGTAPSQLWRSDGTAPGTVELTQFPDSGYSTMSSLTPWNGQLFFRDANNNLWRSDGTVAGTSILKQGSVSALFAASNYLYFVAFSPNDYYYRLWRTDGTPAGTIQVSTANSPTSLGEIAGRLYFLAEGYLWRTDGTAASTFQVSNFGYLNNVPVVMGGAIYYSASAEYPNYELWKTDGTPEGSSLVKDIRPGTSGSNPRNLTPAGSLLYFTADDGTHGEELWRTDGTEAGTFLLKDVLPGAGSSTLASMLPVNGALYFVANDGIDGYELWKSDGTVAGTVLVADIAPGATSSDPQYLAAGDGKVWFAASTAASGVELWTSDGTPQGTMMVAELEPGSTSSSPREMTSSGRRLYFSASTASGRELWALPLAASAFSISDARIVEQNSGSQLLRFTVTRSGDLSQAATVAYTTVNASATAGTDYTAQAGSLPFGIGATSAFIDVPIIGDVVIEKNETFFVNISSPSSGAIERNTGAGLIEDNDRTSALSVGLIQGSYGGSRQIVVTNAGPSSATGIQLRYTESPGNPSFYSYNYANEYTCTFTAGSALCTVATLLPGESRTITLNRYSSYSLYYEQANPPGQTATATVTASELDPDTSNNTIARMISIDGSLMTPSFLVMGTTAAAEYLLNYTSSSPTQVTLASTNPIVVASPSPATIPAGQLGAVFSLQVGNATGTTKLSAGQQTAMVLAIVAPGGTPKLDTVILGPNYTSTYYYGQDIVIPAKVLARTVAGALPTGTVQLLDEADQVLAQQVLDADASATFTLSGVLPGQYVYRARYLGDTNFNPLTVTYPNYYMYGWRTSTSVVIPKVLCGNVLDVMITVTTQDTTVAPTGQVTIQVGNETQTLNLVPTAEAGTARAMTQFALPQSYYSAYATYIPTGTFSGSSGYDYLPSVGGCGPIGLSATATAVNRVALTWNNTGASSYEIHRADTYGFSLVGYATTNSYLDTQVQADRTYTYRVRPVGGLLSEPDIATTFFFTNDPIVAQVTKVQALHFLQLRTGANLARTAARLSQSQAISTPPATGGMIRAVHINELRAAIDEARRYLGLLPLTYTNPTLTSTTPIKAIHLQELRNALK